jgi:uncharacterized protein YneF (UPF0154 family)
LQRSADSRFSLLLSVLLLLIESTSVRAQQPPTTAARIEGQAILEANVGMMASIHQVVFPGTELIPRRTDPRTAAAIVRIDAVYPHADGFRYDLTWSAYEPGVHDLAAYLVRKDGTSADDLPPLNVSATSVLPTDRIAPNSPGPGAPSSVGGYRTLMWIAVVLWVVGLAAFLITGRNKASEQFEPTADSPRARLEAIRELLHRATSDSNFSIADKARLEGLIVGFWREHKQIQDLSAQMAIRQLQEDPDAGPLLKQLERWLYDRPEFSPVEVASLLMPLQLLVEHAEASIGEPIA